MSPLQKGPRVAIPQNGPKQSCLIRDLFKDRWPVKTAYKRICIDKKCVQILIGRPSHAIANMVSMNCLRGQFDEMLGSVLCALCWSSVTLRVATGGLDLM